MLQLRQYIDAVLLNTKKITKWRQFTSVYHHHNSTHTASSPTSTDALSAAATYPPGNPMVSVNVALAMEAFEALATNFKVAGRASRIGGPGTGATSRSSLCRSCRCAEYSAFV